MKFELESYHRDIPNEELIDDIIRVAKLLQKNAVTIDEYNDHGKYHATTLTRRFGSWFKVLEKAGLEKNRPPIGIPEEELFRNLEEVWTKLGRQPRYAEMKKPLSLYSAGTYEKRFVKWRDALKAFVRYVNAEEV